MMWTHDFALPVRRCVLSLSLLVLVGAGGRRLHAEGAADPLPAPPSTLSAAGLQRYCGLHCLYALLKLSGRDVIFQDLVLPEYLTADGESTVDDLKRALEDHGLYALTFSRFTISDLRRLPFPAILHVKAALDAPKYDHYELFLGTESAGLRMLRPPATLERVAVRDLAPRWDGRGLVVSAQPVDPASIFRLGRNRHLRWGGCGVVAILALHLVKRWHVPHRYAAPPHLLLRPMGQATGLVLVAAISGASYHTASPGGFLSYPPAVASLQHAHLSNFIPKVGDKAVRKMLGTRTQFVDARLSPDYQAGHLEKAISIPVNATAEQYRQALQTMVKQTPVVVYCQSSGCPFANRVASKLVADGFTHVAIFRAGWSGWVAKHGEPGRRPTSPQVAAKSGV